jgi:hypothetical protein
MSGEKVDLSHLAEKWPSSIVAREKIHEFTGGAIGPSRILNLETNGKGPPGKMKMGGKIVYPVKDLVRWLEQRTKK